MKAHPLVKEILVTSSEIDQKCQILGKEISAYYQAQKLQEKTVLCLGLLKGCIPFMAKLISEFENIECETEYLVVSSYFGGLAGNSTPQILCDLTISVLDRDILIIDDIIDSGRTIKMIKEYLLSKGAKSVKIVTLLDKKAGREVELIADWYGFDVPHAFLIGFGLDYEERLRNLPYVAIADIEKIKTWKW